LVKLSVKSGSIQRALDRYGRAMEVLVLRYHQIVRFAKLGVEYPYIRNFCRKLSVRRAAVLAVTVASVAWCQSPTESGSSWQNPFSFDVTNAGMRLAVTGSMKGRAISDGKTVEISVERCQLYRPKTFDQPQEVTKITAAIIRRGQNGNRRHVLSGDSHVVNQTLNPDQTAELESFQLRIRVADYPLLKGDTLAFELVIPTTSQGMPAIGTVPIYVKDPLPVTHVAAYCADTMNEFKRPGGPIQQAYHVCYDSAGRSRSERWYYPSADAPKSAGTLGSIEIRDPVANLIYNLDPRTKKAQRRKGFTSAAGFGVVPGGIIGTVPGGSPALTPVITDNMLGSRQINGVEADGKLHTTVYPAGYQGRVEEVTTTDETWYSFRIQAQVRQVRTDPRNGDSEYQMKSIEVGEPGAGLFRVPDDYEVVDMK
jgi:hypothetical protein